MRDQKSGRLSGRMLPLAGLALFAFPAMLFSDGATVDGSGAPVARNRYIGVNRCKTCHSAEESGDQYAAWKGMKHAEAFEVLASDEAKKLAKAKGIADPQKAEECMKCHDTAFGKPKAEVHRSFKHELGVQCESCHGPGEKHLKARMMAAATETAPAKYSAIAEGEIISDPPMETCLACHNDESPGFKPFCFYKFKADIRHLNPRKPRTAEDRAAMLVCGCGEKCECVKGCEDGKCGVPPDKK
jgi:hypothetical protein